MTIHIDTHYMKAFYCIIITSLTSKYMLNNYLPITKGAERTILTKSLFNIKYLEPCFNLFNKYTK